MAAADFNQENVHVAPIAAVYELRNSLMAHARGCEHNNQAIQAPD
jgi:hypothetical protein